jgi:ABC-2 type transport system permease protein
MTYRRTKAIFVKELRHIVRDVRSLGAALALPLLYLTLFGFALSLDVDGIPTMIRDADRSSASRDLIHQFRGSRYFNIVGYVNTDREVERVIDETRALMVISIPRDYSRRLPTGLETPVQLLVDGSDSNTASIALSYANTLLANYALQLRSHGQNHSASAYSGSPVDAQLRVWYNSSLESKNYVVPGLVAVVLMIIATFLTSLTIAREWEMNTMEQLLSTPVRPGEIALGKMLAYFVVGITDMTIAVLAALFVFDVPMRGSFLLLAVTSCLFLFGALLWGIFISASARSQAVAFQLGALTSFLPAMQLSGFIYAVETMPAPIRILTYIVPARYFLVIVKGIFLKGVGVRVLWQEILFLTIFCVFVFFRTARSMRQKVA